MRQKQEYMQNSIIGRKEEIALLEKYDQGLISQEEVITKAQDPATAMIKIQELDAIRAMKNAQ